MNSVNRDQYKEVDKRFDKEFTCVVTYEKWPDEEEQRLREPQYKFKDFPNTNPKIIKSFLHSELEKVRQETRKNTIVEIFEAGQTEDYYESRRAMTYLDGLYEQIRKNEVNEALSINKKNNEQE